MKKSKIKTTQNADKTTFSIDESYEKVLSLDYNDLMHLCDLITESNEIFKENLEITIETKGGSYTNKNLEQSQYKNFLEDGIKKVYIKVSDYKTSSYITLYFYEKSSHSISITTCSEVYTRGLYGKVSDFLDSKVCFLTKYKNFLKLSVKPALIIIFATMFLMDYFHTKFGIKLRYLFIPFILSIITLLLESSAPKLKNIFWVKDNKENFFLNYFKSEDFKKKLIDRIITAIITAIITIPTTAIVTRYFTNK